MTPCPSPDCCFSLRGRVFADRKLACIAASILLGFVIAPLEAEAQHPSTAAQKRSSKPAPYAASHGHSSTETVKYGSLDESLSLINPNPPSKIGSWFSKLWKPPTHSEVAAINVTLVNVSHWETVKEQLRTTFVLDEGDALTKALPVTQAAEHELIDALKVALKLSGPIEQQTSEVKDVRTYTESSNVPATASTPEITDDFTRTETDTSTVNPPDLEKVPDADSVKPKDYARPSQISDHKSRSEELGIDPFMQYRVAQALKQSVALLNRSVDDIAGSEGNDVYVLTLQINLMPFKRGQAYDAYSDISFFPYLKDEEVALKAQPNISDLKSTFKDQPVLPLNQSPRTLYTINKLHGREFDFSREQKNRASPLVQKDNPNLIIPGDIPDVPKVLPLIVTDNLESSSYKSAMRTIRQFSIAAAYANPALAANGSLEKMTDEVTKIIGEDFNSLMSVTRLDQNTLRVRLGANQQGRQQFAMVPQNHRVHLLLLCPKRTSNAEESSGPKESQWEFLSTTRLRDVKKGKMLAERNLKDLEHIARVQLGPFVKSGILAKEFLRADRIFSFWKLHEQGKYAEFTGHLERDYLTKPLGVGFAPEIWNAYSQIWSGSIYTAERFTLAEPAGQVDFKLTLPNTPLLLFDDRSKSVIRIGNFYNSSTLDGKGKPTAAYLQMKLAGSDDTTATFDLPSTELKLLADGMAEITFPSLTAFRNVKSLELMLPGQKPVAVMWHPLEAPAAKTAAKVNLGTTSIVEQSGKGEINLGFEAPLESKYYLHIIDATVTGTIDTTLAEVVSGKSGVYKLLAQKGTVQLQLINLDVRNKVKFYISPDTNDPEQQIKQGVAIAKAELSIAEAKTNKP